MAYISGQELAYRPHVIGLSADGTFTMTAIRYRSYGGEVATPTATADVRECTPNCVAGSFDRPRAALRFSRQIQCRGLTIYSRLHYVLSGPLPTGFPRQGTEPLLPVGEEGC